MKIEKIVAYTAIAAFLVLLAVPVGARFPNARLANIQADGTLTLFNMTMREPPAVPDLALASAAEGFDLEIVDVDFVAMVPNIIGAGAYPDAEFHGFAGAGEENIKLNGILKVDLEGKGINFWVQFALARPAGISEGLYSANGMLEITISEDGSTLPEVTWVLMKGRVEKFEGDDAFGNLIAHAKKGGDNEWTKVHCVFSLKPPPSLEEKSTPGTYVHEFYVVTLANATKTELNNGVADLYIEGNWTIRKETITVTVTENSCDWKMQSELVADGKTGYLSADFDSEFTLDIDNFGVITGEVVFFHAKHARLFEPGLPRGDFNKDRRVNIEDIVRMAKAYRAKLGEPGYDLDLDVNPDHEINIIDLTVAAKEFGQEY